MTLVDICLNDISRNVASILKSLQAPQLFNGYL